LQDSQRGGLWRPVFGVNGCIIWTFKIWFEIQKRPVFSSGNKKTPKKEFFSPLPNPNLQDSQRKVSEDKKPTKLRTYGNFDFYYPENRDKGCRAVCGGEDRGGEGCGGEVDVVPTISGRCPELLRCSPYGTSWKTRKYKKKIQNMSFLQAPSGRYLSNSALQGGEEW